MDMEATIAGQGVPLMKGHILHRNVPWVEAPWFSSILASSDLSPLAKEMAKSYARDGYVIFDFPGQDIERASENIRRLFTPRQSAAPACFTEAVGETPRRIQDAWKTSPTARAIATNPAVLAMLRILYRREPIPFQTLNFQVGTEQRTHSDTIHFHCVPHRFMCGVWLALEDIDEANGPLHIYPGSHRLPVMDMHDIGLPSGRDSYDAYEAAIRELTEELHLSKKKVFLKKGQALVWAANVLHGGEPILNRKRTRISQVTHYFFENCLYYTPMDSDPFLGKVAVREITNILDGKTVPNMYAGKKIDAASAVAHAATMQATAPRASHFARKILRKIAGI